MEKPPKVQPGAQGPTVAFSVLRADGSHVGYAEAEKLAALGWNPR